MTNVLVAAPLYETKNKQEGFLCSESVVEGWNRLPDQVKMTASKDAFKRMLQKNEH